MHFNRSLKSVIERRRAFGNILWIRLCNNPLLPTTLIRMFPRFKIPPLNFPNLATFSHFFTRIYPRDPWPSATFLYCWPPTTQKGLFAWCWLAIWSTRKKSGGCLSWEAPTSQPVNWAVGWGWALPFQISYWKTTAEMTDWAIWYFKSRKRDVLVEEVLRLVSRDCSGWMKWSELWVGNVTGPESCLPSILSHSLSDSPTRAPLSSTNFYLETYFG